MWLPVCGYRVFGRKYKLMLWKKMETREESNGNYTWDSHKEFFKSNTRDTTNFTTKLLQIDVVS